MVVPQTRRSNPLAGLDPESLAEFVAAVWDARGWTTRVEGRRVVATRPDAAEAQTLLALSRRRDPWVVRIDDGVDVVVDARGTGRGRRVAAAAGVRYLDGDDVVEMVRYGLPPAEADRLLRTHLERSMASVVARPEPRPSPLVVAAALVVVLAGVAVIHLGGEASDPSAATTPTEASPPEPAYPPGVDGVGVVSAARLARAHRAALDDRPYRWVVTYRRAPVGADDGTEDRLRQTVVVVNDTAFHRERRGTRAGPASASGSFDSGTYADGEQVYRRESRLEEPVYSRAEVESLGYDANVFHAESERYVVRYVTAPRTDVVVDEGRYRVTVRGVPPNLVGNVSNYTARAVVEPGGFVSRLTAAYDVRVGGRTYRIEFASRYETGDVALSPPPWYPEARAATSHGTLSPSPSQSPSTPQANRSTNATTSANSSGATP